MTNRLLFAALSPAIAVLLLAIAGASAGAAELRVTAVGLRNAQGTMRFALYNRPQGFATTEGRLAFRDIPIVSTEGTTAVFADLPPGRYALAVFHDENDNDEFDTNFLGIPREGFGFSRDPAVFLSAPGFDDCALDLGTEDRIATIRIKY